jgi:sarcosine oxidase
MDTTRTDILIAGLGGIGAATAYHASQKGLAVVGLEQFHALHDRGSSHGHSRIFRIAYFESPDYVPLARRSLEGWRALERATDRDLLRTTGGLDLGRADGRLVSGSLAACAAHDIDHEHWDRAMLAARAPGLDLPEGVEAVYQPDAGILNPTRCTGTHIEAARASGADLRFSTRVIGWEPHGDGIRVRAEGPGGPSEIVAGRLIVTTGAWLATGPLAGLLPEIVPERQVVGWLPHIPGSGAGHRFPVVNADLEEGHVYLMPQHSGRGVKVGLYHHLHEGITDPDRVDAPPSDADRALLQALADRYLVASLRLTHMRTCRFTLTPDEHFVIDTTEGGRIVIGGGFSGHGFKFAPALGEVLTALAVGEDPPVEVGSFRLDRFGVAV